METLILICSILSVLISLPAIAIALYTLVEIKAFQRSTHKVEFMPVSPPSKKDNAEFLNGFSDDMSDQFII